MKNNVSRAEMRQALQNHKETPVFGTDVGNGQNAVFLHLPNWGTYRLRLSARQDINLLSVMALIYVTTPSFTQEVTVPFLSNSLTEYDSLMKLPDIAPEKVKSYLEETGERSRLLTDLMLTAVSVSKGDVLYVPVPDGCSLQVMQAVEQKLQDTLELYRRLEDEHYLVFGFYTQVKCVKAHFSILFQDFKRSPEQWYEPYYSGYRSYTYRDLMQLYFGALLQRAWLTEPGIFALLMFGMDTRQCICAFLDCVARHNEQGLACSEQYMLIEPRAFRMVVGCPAYPAWTRSESRRQYSELLKKAAERAGLYEMKPGRMGFFPNSEEKASDKADGNGVVISRMVPEIFPEPSAAMMPHVTYSRSDKPLLHRGVVILDSGAFSNDICIIYYGLEKTYRFNCSSDTFGGARIEQRMLEILKRELLSQVDGRSMLDFDPEENAANELFLRMVKERYYPECRDVQQSIYFRLGDQVYRKAFSVKELIEKALNTRYRAGNEDDSSMKSWLQRALEFRDRALKEFFNATGLDKEMKFHSLILTGGTSNVQELRRIMENEDRFIHVVQEEDPSGCVGNGLALTIANEELEDFAKAIITAPELNALRDEVKAELCSILVKYADRHINQVVDRHIEKKIRCMQSEFCQEVTNALNGDHNLKTEIQKVIENRADKCCEQIVAVAQMKAPHYFSGRLPVLNGHADRMSWKEQDNVSTQMINDVVKKINVPALLTRILSKVADALNVVLGYWVAYAIAGPIGMAVYTLYRWATKDDRKKKKAEDTEKDKTINIWKFKQLKKKLTDMKHISEAAEKAFAEADVVGAVCEPLVDAAVLNVTMTAFDVDIEGTRIG